MSIGALTALAVAVVLTALWARTLFAPLAIAIRPRGAVVGATGTPTTAAATSTAAATALVAIPVGVAFGVGDAITVAFAIAIGARLGGCIGGRRARRPLLSPFMTAGSVTMLRRPRAMMLRALVMRWRGTLGRRRARTFARRLGRWRLVTEEPVKETAQ